MEQSSKILTDAEISAGIDYANIIGPFHAYLHKFGRFPHPGQWKIIRAFFVEGKKILFIQCGRKFGKALSVNTPILTSLGWKMMGDIRVGDLIYGSDGKFTLVTFVSEIMHNRKCYDVIFKDGSVITADADHNWVTTTREVRRSQKRNRGRMLKRSPLKEAKIVTTEEIKNTLLNGREFNHVIQNSLPLKFPRKNLKIDPYTLGVWLGDGNSRCAAFYGNDAEIAEHIEAAGYEVKKTKQKYRWAIHGLYGFLREGRFLGNKHIPEEYLFCSISQRLSLLRGLMDTDGYCNKKGNYTDFCNTNKSLSLGVKFLAESLGMTASLKEKIPLLKGKKCAKAYIVSIAPTMQIFKLKRKADRLEKYLLLENRKTKSFKRRTIVSVVERDSVPVKCIEVDNESHLFLAGNSFIPTHNTDTLLYICWRICLTRPGSFCYIIAPTKDQGKDIYWIPERLQKYGPQQFIEDHHSSQLSTIFKVKNAEGINSRIIIDGSENINALRGPNPDFVAYEEFRDHKKEFDLAVMRPNLLAKSSSLVTISTPPDTECYYTEFRNEVLESIASGDKDYFYLELPTSENPKINKAWLEKEKIRLEKKGETALWNREFMGKLVPGGVNAVLPMWQRRRTDILKSPDEINEMIERDRKSIRWFSFSDPAQSCFAVLFIGLHKYNNTIFVVDEIYEKDRLLTSAGKIWPRVLQIEAGHWAGTWYNYYDPAASWFQVDVYNKFKSSLSSVKKHGAKDTDAVSLIKDIIDEPKALFISTNCPGFLSEWDNWVDINADKNDHQIDNFFYFLKASAYSINPSETEHEEMEDGEENESRATSLEQMMREAAQNADPLAFTNGTMEFKEEDWNLDN